MQIKIALVDQIDPCNRFIELLIHVSIISPQSLLELLKFDSFLVAFLNFALQSSPQSSRYVASPHLHAVHIVPENCDSRCCERDHHDEGYSDLLDPSSQCLGSEGLSLQGL